MTDENSFGSILKRLRLDKRKKSIEKDIWTQEAVARRIGVTRQAYSAWIRGDSLPSVDNLKRIVEIFRPNEKDELALYRAVAHVPPEKKKLPSRNTLFTGRNDYLDKLHQKLQGGGSVAITQAVGISGLGGIGKTQIALEYAHQYHPQIYRTALWVNAADRATLQADYDAIAHLLELPERDEQEAERRVEAVKRWLDEHTRWLLIMDNADDLDLATSFLPAKLLGRVVFTTRSQLAHDSNIAAQITVEVMGPEEGLSLLLRRGVLKGDAGPDAVDADTRESALRIVELLDGLPLALDQAGAYIGAAKVSLTDYIQRYETQRRRLLGKRWLLENKSSKPHEDIRHPDSVATTFALSFQRACEWHPLAGDILDFCAFLHPDDIPEELFQYDDTFKSDPVEFDEAIGALRQYSLIKRDEHKKTLSLHRLVQVVLIDTMSADPQKQWRDRVVRTLDAAFPDVGRLLLEGDFDFFEGRRQCGCLLPHVLACSTWANDALTPTAALAKLFRKAATYLHGRSRFSEAKPFLSRVLSIYEHHFDVGYPSTAHELSSLALLCHEQHEYNQAEALYRQALTVVEKHLGAEHPYIALIMQKLARLYEAQNKYDQAERLLVQVLSHCERHIGVEHLDTLWSLHDLADFYFRQRRYNQAEALYKHGLTIREKQLGIEHHDTARSLYNLAVLYLEQCKDEQAASLFLRVFKIWEQCLGTEHPDTIDAVYVLAVLLDWQGKHEQADAYYHILEQRLGEKFTSTCPEDRDELCNSLSFSMG